MKIEFRCDNCDCLLRVTAVHVGNRIGCPTCSTLLIVPDPAQDRASTLFDETLEAEDSVRVWEPQTVPLSAILRDAWTLYVENLWTLLAVAFIDLLLWAVGILLIIVPAVGTFAVLLRAIGVPPPLSVLGMFIVLALGFMYLVNAMTCTQTRFFLKVARGEPTHLLDAFHVGWNRGAVTMLPTVFAAISLSGLTLCIVPGVVVYLFFWPYIWIWADQQTGGSDTHAFPLARDLSSRNFGTSLAITSISVLMTLFGLMIFGQSLGGILKAVAYLKMSGQEVTGITRRPDQSLMPVQEMDPA